MIHSTLVKLLSVKVAAAAAAICTVGGVATAAATGHLALPSHDSSPSTSGHTATSASHSRAESSTSGVSSTGHDAAPSPSLIGLCHAYTAGAGSAHGKALDNPAFTVLITSAGGRTKVDAYCATVLSGKSAGSSTARGTRSSIVDSAPGRSADGHKAGTDHPTGAPATHPTGAPATHPTGSPQPHPTSKPNTHPTGAPGNRPTGAPATHGSR